MSDFDLLKVPLTYAFSFHVEIINRIQWMNNIKNVEISVLIHVRCVIKLTMFLFFVTNCFGTVWYLIGIDKLINIHFSLIDQKITFDSTKPRKQLYLSTTILQNG